MSLWVIECLEQKVSVEFSQEINVDQLFGPLFADFQLSPAHQVEGELLKVNVQENGWVIVDSKMNEERHVSKKGDLVYFLSDKIIYHLINRITIGHCVHAACVAKGELAYVLPANSGCGKSSFTCWLVANGFDYISDELTILLASGRVSAISRPIQIKDHGIAAVKHLINDSAQVLKGDFANAISAEMLGGQRSVLNEWELGGMIFPQFTEGLGFSYELMKSASAAMQLMGSHVNARNLDSHGFRFMTELARQTPAYKLEYGGFDFLPESFNKIIINH